MALEKDGIKYACLSCIRGHRVKKCQHVDRKLIAVSKRGRQISQCTHCRGLRALGSHVKCTCATAAVPNPLNGCLCEVIQTCTCVARHLQNTQLAATDIDNVTLLPPSSHSSSLSPATTTATLALQSLSHPLSSSKDQTSGLFPGTYTPENSLLSLSSLSVPSSSSTATSPLSTPFDSTLLNQPDRDAIFLSNFNEGHSFLNSLSSLSSDRLISDLQLMTNGLDSLQHLHPATNSSSSSSNGSSNGSSRQNGGSNSNIEVKDDLFDFLHSDLHDLFSL